MIPPQVSSLDTRKDEKILEKIIMKHAYQNGPVGEVVGRKEENTKSDHRYYCNRGPGCASGSYFCRGSERSMEGHRYGDN